MNLVLDEAEEVSMKRKTRKALGTRSCFAAHFVGIYSVQIGILGNVLTLYNLQGEYF